MILGIIMNIAMKYPWDFMNIAMKYPWDFMKIAMKYPGHHYENRNEIFWASL
jgi:hypothetical protein